MSERVRDRHLIRGRIYCRITELIDTDAPTVKTAVLACGRRIRLNMVGFRRDNPPKMTTCTGCTEEHQQRKALAAAGQERE